MTVLAGFFSLCWWRILVSVVFAYLIGSVNFAVTYTKLVKKQDIRTMGSGNAGFTNMLRCVGVVPAVMTFVFDFFKGAASVLLAKLLFGTLDMADLVLKSEYGYYGMFLAGLFCVVGHSFPVFFKFKGGKGVVTTAAMMLVIDWRFMLLVLGTFLIVFALSRIISLGSICAGLSMGPWNWFIMYNFVYKPSLGTDLPHNFSFVVITTVMAVAVAAFAIIKHKDNIKRILKGEEKKITAKKKEAK